MRLRFLSSLKLAVFIILALAASLATATVLESLYDTPTAQYYVYKTLWFYGIMGLMVVSLVAVMVDRWPWKGKHSPFIMAHIGIITLLIGSWITQRYGLDGSLRVSEGETTSAVELDDPILVLSEGQNVKTVPMPWRPPGASFKPVALKSADMPYDLTVDQYLPHAEPIYDFVPRAGTAAPLSPDGRPMMTAPAVKVRLTGGPMKITQEYWLWTGDPGFAAFSAGPAWLELKAADAQPSPEGAGHKGPRLTLDIEKDGGLSYTADSSTHELVKGRFAAKDVAGKRLDPKWRGGVSIELLAYIPDAAVNTSFKPSRVLYGEMAPPAAIEVVAGAGADQAKAWLGLGSRAMLHTSGHDVEISYLKRRVILPFGVRLDRFKVDTYEGGQKPSAYSSRVTVTGGAGQPPAPASGGPGPGDFSQLISMNEPLVYRGITLYQASYEDAMPRPVTSILAVNRDPGRIWKYMGSLEIVIGAILLFAMKYMKRSTGAVRPGGASAASGAT